MRVFLDTNVMLAAFATRGICADLVRLVLTGHDLITSRLVFRELRRVLTEQLSLPATTADQLIPFLREQGQVSNPKRPAPWPESDLHHRWILAAALEGDADVLVTGDPALLEIGTRVPLQITDPRGFWHLIRHF